MLETTYAYFAGLIDGEGCLMLAKRSDRPSLKPTVQVKMSHEETIRRLQKTFGGRVKFCAREKEHHKDQWRWTGTNRVARECLERVAPYMVTKRAEAEHLLAYMAVKRRKGPRPKR